MANNYGYLDPSSANDGNDIAAGQTRRNSSPNRTTNAVKFLVRVLTRPIPMDADDARVVLQEGWIPPAPRPQGDFDITQPFGGADDSQRTTDQRLLGADGVVRIMFRGRVIRSNNGLQPHIFLKDPCRLDISRDLGFIYRLLAKHTLFMSKLGFNGTVPKVGDVVEVTLQRGDFTGPDLQTAYFDEIVDGTQSELYTYSSFSGGCASLIVAMDNGGFEPGEWAEGGGGGDLNERSRRASDAENILTLKGLAVKQLLPIPFGSATPQFLEIYEDATGDSLNNNLTWTDGDFSILGNIESWIGNTDASKSVFTEIVNHVKAGGANWSSYISTMMGSSYEFFPDGVGYRAMFSEVVGRDSRELTNPTELVFHHSATAGSDGGRATERITLGRDGHSYHFTIYKDGSIDHCIPIDFRHIGSNNKNSNSIGISFENLGNQVEHARLSHVTNPAHWDGANAEGEFDGNSLLVGTNGHRGPWDPYTIQQYKSCFWLVCLLKVFRPSLTTIVTHASYRTSKQDVGPNFLYYNHMSTERSNEFDGSRPGPMHFFRRILTWTPS